MARSKNATALFEVIHTAKKPPKASPTGGGIPAPKWWAKGGGKNADRPAVDPAADTEPTPEPTAGTRRSWLAAARRSAEPSQPGTDALPDEQAEASKVVITRIYPPDAPDRRSVEVPDGPPDPASGDEGPVFAASQVDEPEEAPVAERPAERPSWSERRARALAERSSSSSDPAFDPTADVAAADLRTPRANRWADEEPPPAPRERRPRRSAGPTPSAMVGVEDSPVTLDRSAGEVRFRLSYGGAVAAAVILLVVILIAYLAGQSVGQHSGAESAADLTAGGRPAPTGVATAAAPAATTSAMLAATAPAAGAVGPASAVPAAVAAAPAAAPVPAADPVTAEPPARKVGQMYVVLQSYPDRETAQPGRRRSSTAAASPAPSSPA